ncbi:hypothetical protein [Saccharopolyspora rosea]|uniref:hypothetical protein n=1 Tax=Saccharopolyspora rosea TaxID=524884 RepID=UPI0021D8FF86|nr:hypothetical protein [Saccharopolyspora rosea]
MDTDAEETVDVAGTAVGAGAKVRLVPRERGTDAQDMFVRGRIATVRAVRTDVDGGRWLAVTLDDDPGAELFAAQGRYRYFGVDEVQPVAGDEGA